MVRQRAAERQHPAAHRWRGEVPQQRGARPEEGQRRHVIRLAQAVGRYELEADRRPGLQILAGQDLQDLRTTPEVFNPQHVIQLGEVRADLRPQRQGLHTRGGHHPRSLTEAFQRHVGVLFRQLQGQRQRRASGRGPHCPHQAGALLTEFDGGGARLLVQRDGEINPGDDRLSRKERRNLGQGLDGRGRHLAGAFPQLGEQLERGRRLPDLCQPPGERRRCGLIEVVREQRC